MKAKTPKPPKVDKKYQVKSINKDGRWTLDELDSVMPLTIGRELSNPSPTEPPRK